MNSPGAADSKGVGDGQGINVDVLLHVVHGRVQGGLHAGRHIRTLVVTRGPDSAEGIWISSTQWSADQKARSGSDGTLFFAVTASGFNYFSSDLKPWSGGLTVKINRDLKLLKFLGRIRASEKLF